MFKRIMRQGIQSDSKNIPYISFVFIGIIGEYFINLILKRFPDKFRIYMDEWEKQKKDNIQNQSYHQIINEVVGKDFSPNYSDIMVNIIREDYSLSFIGKNTLIFIIIIFITSLIEAVLFYLYKNIVSLSSDYVLLIPLFIVFILPLSIELFVRNNRYRKIDWLKIGKMVLFYRIYIFRIRPVLCLVAIIPLIIVWFL